MKKKMLAASAVMSAALLPAIRPASVSGSIATIYSGGAGSYSVTGTVTAVLNTSTGTTNTFAVQDGTGSVIAYAIPKATYTATLGDSVSFTATNSPYQGAPELVAAGFTLGSNTSGTAPAPPVLTIPQFNTAGNGSVGVVPYAEAMVTLDNVSFATFPSTLATNTTYTLDDVQGDTTPLYGYKSYSLVLNAVNAANAAFPGGYSGTYDITGYADTYYGAAEIYPTSIVEVSSSAVPEPASLSLLGIATGGLLVRRRRQTS